MKKQYSPELIRSIVAESTSKAEVFRKLGLDSNNGGNYRSLNHHIKKLNLDTSHFTGALWSKGRTLSPKRPIEDYLNNEVFIGSDKLKKRLFKEGLKERKCEDLECGITHWKNQPAPFHLHHLDGNPSNNNLSNLQILCPNCHALTPNHCGKSAYSKVREKIERTSKPKKTVNPNWRTEPKPNLRKVERPSKEELTELLKTESLLALGRKFGVSDNAVRKWAKLYEIVK